MEPATRISGPALCHAGRFPWCCRLIIRQRLRVTLGQKEARHQGTPLRPACEALSPASVGVVVASSGPSRHPGSVQTSVVTQMANESGARRCGPSSRVRASEAVSPLCRARAWAAARTASPALMTTKQHTHASVPTAEPSVDTRGASPRWAAWGGWKCAEGVTRTLDNSPSTAGG